MKLPISRSREIAGTDKMGTNAYGVVQAAEQLGFTAKGASGLKMLAVCPRPAFCVGNHAFCAVYQTNLMV